MRKILSITLSVAWMLILPALLTYYYTTKRGVSKQQLERGMSYAYESIVTKPLEHGIKQLNNNDSTRTRRDTFTRIEPKIFKAR